MRRSTITPVLDHLVLADPLYRRITHRRRFVDTVVLIVGFLLLYLATRSSLLAGDGEQWARLAENADAGNEHYGGIAHFLQIPIAHVLSLGSKQLHLPVSGRELLLTISLAGNLAAIVFTGLIAEELLGSRRARWIASLLLGTSLTIWIQWNGELHALGLGFTTAAVFYSLRHRIVLAAILWAFAVVSHSELALAAPLFLVATIIGRPSGMAPFGAVRKALFLMLLAGTCALTLLLVGGHIVGRWHDFGTFVNWFWNSFGLVENQFVGRQPVRAMRGLITAYSVAGHFWTDIVRGRGALVSPSFALASSVGLVVLLATMVFVTYSRRMPHVLWLALAWLVPFQVMFNWRFMPAVEEHHGSSLPGFVLLVTAGLVSVLGATSSVRGRAVLGAYVALFAGLNLVAAVLPVKAYGADVLRAEDAIRRLNDGSRDRTAFVSCSGENGVYRAGIRYLRVRELWGKGPASVGDVEMNIVSWMQNEIEAGNTVYVVGRACFPGEWLPNPRIVRFELAFLEQHFKLVATSLPHVPHNGISQTNAFSWLSSEVFCAIPLSSEVSR